MNIQLRNAKKISYGCTIALLFLFCLSTLTPAISVPSQTLYTDKWASEFRPYGQYADELVFVVFTEGEIPLAMLALQNGEIESYDDRVLSAYMGPLIHDENIEVTFTLGVRYRALVLNCERFPTNITGYRRAMAYGLDKYQANQEAVGGVGIPLDSYIPFPAAEWEVESQVGGEFYDRNIVAGNASLEAAGFKDLDGDGWREYDKNGNDAWDAGVDIDDAGCAIELWPTLDYDPAIICTQIALDGLNLMGMRGTIVEMNFGTIIDEVILGNHWVICWTEGVDVYNTAKLLYDNFRSGTSTNLDYYKFTNASIDVALDNMIAATTPEAAKPYALQASQLLAYEQPEIVCYNDAIIGAYRVGSTTQWEGYWEFPGLGVTHGDQQWLGTSIRKKDGTYGGSYRTCLSDNLESLNCFYQTTGYEATVWQYIYETLVNIDPNTWAAIPGLAYDWDIETTTANPGAGIQAGQKFTYYLYKNETWHDGTPFTALDVNFTVQEIWPDAEFYAEEFSNVYKYEVPDNYTFVMYMNTSGFFDWGSVTRNNYIVPMHIWKDALTVGVENFVPTDAQMAGTGPYKWNERVAGQYISLTRHPGWRWSIRDFPQPTTTTTTPPTTPPTTTTTTTTRPAAIDAFAILAGLGTLVLMSSRIYRRKR